MCWAGWVGVVCCVNFLLLHNRFPQTLVASDNTRLLALSSVCQSPSLVWLGFLLRLLQSKIKVLAGLYSYLELGGLIKAHLFVAEFNSSWLQYRGPGFCACSQLGGCSQILEAARSSLPWVASIFKASNREFPFFQIPPLL